MGIYYGSVECNGDKVLGVAFGNECHQVGIQMVCDAFKLRNWDSYYQGSEISEAELLRDCCFIA